MVVRWVWLTVLALLLTACVAAPPRSEMLLTQQVYTGRFAVTYVHSGNSQREQGGFEWRVVSAAGAQAMQSPMTLLLNSPLGTTLAVMQFSPAAPEPERASLRAPQGTITAATLEALMQTVLGWELPLEKILPWLLGVPNTPLASDGWDIEVLSRFDSGKPKVLTASSAQRQIQLRMVFDE